MRSIVLRTSSSRRSSTRAVGEIVEEPGQLGQAVKARPALAGALSGEVAEDVCGAGESTLVGWQRVDDAGTGAGAQVGQAGARQSGAGEHRAGNPTAVVPAQQDSAKRAGIGDTEVPDEVGQSRSRRHFQNRARRLVHPSG